MNKRIDEILKDIEDYSKILPNERNSFLLSLMLVSSYVIQADGKIMHSEMEYVRGFLRKYFGDQVEQKYDNLLLQIFHVSQLHTSEDWAEKIQDCCNEMSTYMTEQQRLLLMAFLIEIARADSIVEASEIDSLYYVSKWLGVNLSAARQLDNLREEYLMSWENY